jgi:hypothetical protein
MSMPSQSCQRAHDWEMVQDTSSSYGVDGHFLPHVVIFFFQIVWEDYRPAFIKNLQEALNGEGIPACISTGWNILRQ